MPSPPITDLPEWPTRNDRPDVFDAKVNAFLPGLTPWGRQVSAVGQFVQQSRESVTTSAAQVAAALSSIVTLRNQMEGFANTAVNAPGTKATSTTEMTIGTGVYVLTVQTGKAFAQGQSLAVSVTGDAAKRMLGILLSYDPGTGVMQFRSDQPFEAGTFASWTIALGPPASIPVATFADVLGRTDNSKAVTAATLAALQQYRALTDAAILSWNVATHGLNVSVVLGGNRSLPTPTGLAVGDYLECIVQQPLTGGPRTLAIENTFKFGAAGQPVLNTAAGAWDVIRGKVLAITPATVIDAQHKKL